MVLFQKVSIKIRSIKKYPIFHCVLATQTIKLVEFLRKILHHSSEIFKSLPDHLVRSFMLKFFYKQANLVQISATKCVKRSLSCFKSILSKGRCSQEQYWKHNTKFFSKLLLTSPSTEIQRVTFFQNSYESVHYCCHKNSMYDPGTRYSKARSGKILRIAVSKFERSGK